MGTAREAYGTGGTGPKRPKPVKLPRGDAPGMKRLFARLVPKSRLGRGVLVLTGGTAAGQAIVLLASPLLTRLYTPADFGVLGVFSGLLGLLALAVCLRYELAVPLAEDDVAVVNLVALAAASALLVSSVVAVLLGAFGGMLVRWLNAAALGPWLWLLPPALLAIGGFNALNHWAIRRQAFERITRTRITQSLGQVAAQLGLGLAGAGAPGLLLGHIIGQSAGIGSHGAAFWRRERALLAQIRPGLMLALARRFGRLAAYGAPGALLNGSSRLLPALLVAALYGIEVAGLFVLTQRVLGSPMRLLGSAVAQVYLSEAPRLARHDRPAMAVLFRRTTRHLLVVGGVMVVVVVVAGPALFGLVFGNVWSEAGMYARLLAAMYLAQLVVSPISQTLTIIERQDLLLLWEIGRLALVLLVFAGAAWLAWPPGMTLGSLSAAVASAYVALFLLTLRLLKRGMALTA